MSCMCVMAHVGWQGVSSGSRPAEAAIAQSWCCARGRLQKFTGAHGKIL